MKATDLYPWEQGERFVIYIYVTGSDDNGTDTAEEGKSTDTASGSEAFHRIDYIVWNNILKMYEIKMKKGKNI